MINKGDRVQVTDGLMAGHFGTVCEVFDGGASASLQLDSGKMWDTWTQYLRKAEP